MDSTLFTSAIILSDSFLNLKLWQTLAKHTHALYIYIYVQATRYIQDVEFITIIFTHSYTSRHCWDRKNSLNIRKTMLNWECNADPLMHLGRSCRPHKMTWQATFGPAGLEFHTCELMVSRTADLRAGPHINISVPSREWDTSGNKMLHTVITAALMRFHRSHSFHRGSIYVFGCHVKNGTKWKVSPLLPLLQRVLSVPFS